MFDYFMKPNIILLTIDSFRGDKFLHPTTTSEKPNIENLIKTGTYFMNAFSSADATILSWSSLFTGQFPFRTGIRSSRFNKLDENVNTIFDYLHKSKYLFYGFIPKFSEIVGVFPKFENDNYLYDFTERLDSGLDKKILDVLLTLPKKQSWFFNIHLMDLHFPLIVPEKYNNEKYGFSKYEKIISSIDAWIGNLIENIDFENTILIITSDHGTYVKKLKIDSEIIDFEDQGEKEIVTKKLASKSPGIFKPLKDKIFFSMERKKKLEKSKLLSKYNLQNHEKRALLSGHFSIDHFLFDDTLHVPLLFVGKNIPKNKIFTKQVGLVDLLPTLAYLVDINFNYSSCDGKNLFPLKSEEVFSETPTYIESNPLIDLKSNDVVGIRTSNFKYFRDKHSKNKRVHLYDLNIDPFEENNCFSQHKDQVSTMEKTLENLLQETKKITQDENTLTSDEIENELRKMGYV